MANKHCPYCGDQVRSRMACLMGHFAFYAPGYLRYWRGNIQTFGWVDGLRGSLGLSFPFINALLTWKYRKHRIVINPPSEDSHD